MTRGCARFAALGRILGGGLLRAGQRQPVLAFGSFIA
jgi:hypothetical protein